MAKQIEISDWAYEKISSLMSEQDTAGSVVSRLLAEIQPLDGIKPNHLDFHMTAVPDLTFSKITSVKLEGEHIKTNKWKQLRDFIIRHGLKSGIDLEKITSVHIVKGKKVDEGFEYHHDLGLSIQGQSAKDSWKTCSDICSAIDASMEVLIQWRDNEKAAYPRQKARLLIP